MTVQTPVRSKFMRIQTPHRIQPKGEPELEYKSYADEDPSLLYGLLGIPTSSTTQLGSQILKVGEMFNDLTNYTQSRSDAFGYAIDCVLYKYKILIAQLEEHSTNETEIYYYIQPYKHCFTSLLTVIESIGHLKGSELVCGLEDIVSKTAPNAPHKDMLDTVLQETITPLVKMMDQWITTGILSDKYNEFFIKEQNKNHPHRFVLCNVPQFVENPQMVLQSGVNWVILRECGQAITTVDCDESNFLSENYRQSSKKLLFHIIHQNNLQKTLHLFLTVYLWSDSDSMLSLFDMAPRYLMSSPSPLLLKLWVAIREGNDTTLSFSDSGVYHQLLNIAAIRESGPLVIPKGLQEASQAIDLLTIECLVPPALKMVLIPTTVAKFQLMFRHLLQLKYAEFSLLSQWKHCKSDQAPTRKNLLFMKLLGFIQPLLRYIFFELVQVNYDALLLNLKTADSIENLVRIVDDFIATVVRGSLLTETQMVQTIAAILAVARAASDPEPTEEINYNELEKRFDLLVVTFVEQVEIMGVVESGKLGSLVSQIDYNRYYGGLVPEAKDIADAAEAMLIK